MPLSGQLAIVTPATSLGERTGWVVRAFPKELPRPTLLAAPRHPTSPGKRNQNPKSTPPLGLLKLGLPPDLPPPPAASSPLLHAPLTPPPPPTSWALQPSLPPCKVLSYSLGLPVVNKTQGCSPGPLQLILSGVASPTTGQPCDGAWAQGVAHQSRPRGRSMPSSNSSLANSSLSSPPPAPDPGAAAAQPPHRHASHLTSPRKGHPEPLSAMCREVSRQAPS